MSTRSLYEKCYIFNTVLSAVFLVGGLGALAYTALKHKAMSTHTTEDAEPCEKIEPTETEENYPFQECSPENCEPLTEQPEKAEA